MSNEMHLQQIPDGSDAGQVEQRLEQIITAACRAQPLLPAPTSLQSRVMTAIEQHAQQWWRAPLRVWPHWAQAVLMLLCMGSTWLLVADNAPLAASGASVEQWLFMPWTLADMFTSLLMVSRELLWLVLRISPVLWLLALISSGAAVAVGVAGLNRLATRNA